MTNTAVDLSPLLQVLIDYVAGPLAAVMSALLLAILSRYLKKLGLENDEKVRIYLNDALQNGIEFALNKARLSAGGARLTVDLHNETAAVAARYVLDKVPDAIKHFGITPEKVEELVKARMPAPQPGQS
jgi:hypothetical protein